MPHDFENRAVLGVGQPPAREPEDGVVIAAGGGMLVLEELEHAKARGAKIYAEIIGYGATSDGDNMVAPSSVTRMLEGLISLWITPRA